MGVPRVAGAPIVNALVEFEAEVQKVYRDNAATLDDLHNMVADDEHTIDLSLDQIASKALKTEPANLTPAEKYAVHKAFYNFGIGFKSYRTSAATLTRRYFVMPKRELRIFEHVQEWVREFQEASSAGKKVGTSTKPHPLIKFLEKARRLVVRSRKHRAPTVFGTIGPTSKKKQANESTAGSLYTILEGERFSNHDREILQYFQSWCLDFAIVPSHPFHALGPIILRATGLYSDLPLDVQTAALFMQELGLYPPWQDKTPFNVGARLPGHGQDKVTDDLYNEAVEFAANGGGESLQDSMKEYRKDFGNMRVYCIDDADAKEIDDGISLEPVAGCEDQHWLHIHIANPSAFFQPDHILARHAANAVESLYLPYSVYPMIPKSFTQDRVSLAPDRPTLTVSVKLDDRGEILDTKMTSGIIRNVVYITPETVANISSAQGKAANAVEPFTITVGGQISEPRMGRDIQADLSDDDASTIRKLHGLADALQRRRNVKPMWDQASFGLSVQTATQAGAEKRSDLTYPKSNIYLGDPVIQLRGWPHQHFLEENADISMVQSLMVMAGEVASAWCAQRNIPIIYRGAFKDFDTTSPDSQQQALRDKVDTKVSPATVSSYPLPHYSLDVQSYTKFTSPLRRFPDLLLHWQIESALREEARTGRSLVGNSDESYLTFSRDKVEELIPLVTQREKALKEMSVKAEREWACLALFRAFYFREAPLPATFETVITSLKLRDPREGSVGGNSVKGFARIFGLPVMATAVGEVGVKLGEVWETELEEVNCYKSRVSVKLLRKLKGDEEMDALFVTKDKKAGLQSVAGA